MDVRNPTDRVLRAITLVSFVPALIMLIVHGVIFQSALPAIGLVPMFLSSSFGMLYLTRNVKSGWIPFSVDMFLTTFFLAVLLPSWISLVRGWGGNSEIMLGTYSTVPMMFNLCIHIFFIFRNALSAFRLVLLCPHCRNNGNVEPSSGPFPKFLGKLRSTDSIEEVQKPLLTEEYKDARESYEVGSPSRPSGETLL